MKKLGQFLPLVFLGLMSLNAYAYERGDLLVRAGWASVQAGDKSGEVSTIPGSGVGVDSSDNLGFNFSYFVHDKFAIEVLAALPFEHDLKGEGSLGALGEIGSVKHLPPTVTLQYFPMSAQSKIQPHIGLGINYTTFFDEDASTSLKEALGGKADISLDDSVAPAVVMGLDINYERFIFGFEAYYFNLDTDAEINTGQDTLEVGVDIDPWVLLLSVGYRF